MDATKRTVSMLKPKSKKKLLLKAPAAENLDKVAKGITAFSPRSQIELEGIPSEAEPHVQLQRVESVPPVIENEQQIMIASIRGDPHAVRRIERVGIKPAPGEQLEDPLQIPAPALPWELYSAVPAADGRGQAQNDSYSAMPPAAGEQYSAMPAPPAAAGGQDAFSAMPPPPAAANHHHHHRDHHHHHRDVSPRKHVKPSANGDANNAVYDIVSVSSLSF